MGYNLYNQNSIKVKYLLKADSLLVQLFDKFVSVEVVRTLIFYERIGIILRNDL